MLHDLYDFLQSDMVFEIINHFRNIHALSTDARLQCLSC